MLRRPFVALVLAGLLVTAGACAPASLPVEVGPAPTSTASQAPLDVDGRPGQVPRLLYDKPLEVLEPVSRTVWPGTGERLERDHPVLLNIYAEDGRDGTELQNTFRSAPAPYTMTETSLGNHLFAALRGKRAGARVMLMETDTAGGEEVPVVLVVDVLPTRASGTELADPPGGLPRVTRDDLGVPTVRIPRDAKPPQDLEVVPLVRGRGPQVAEGQVITVELHAVTWADRTVVESTWEEGAPPRSAQVGIGALIEGWDVGLVQQPVGSQVMLVVPPDMAYAGTKNPLAGETLVYVIDILDAHQPVRENEKKKD
ncbi:FKBP-type peptidyl-prolyl cis-trans isomerase [Myceligenerans xiligouense]|uniref:Peptidyl-prolyl cis-trans isomerase n=1 Tax=Myceligenerans xiligouense TaxID=253184 RepID=A0A3N4ZJS8_9MICO|nr:FKBP-type peptidyl-prolyl cis-trans isomerase [Myceligenerans xiligouense]RPF21175.1 peptidylprolyl isomerase [Myceligenerans xiligouense]